MRRLPVLAVVVLGLVPGLLAGCRPHSPSPGPAMAVSSSPGTPVASATAGVGLPGDIPGSPARTTGENSPGPSPSSSSDPAAALRSAAIALQATSFRFTLGDDSRQADGRYDSGTRAVSLSRVSDGRATVVYVSGGELLLSGAAPDGTVLRFDLSRLPATHSLFPAATPLLPVSLLTGARKLESHDGGYTGKIDLSKVVTPTADDPGLASTSRYVAYLAKQAGDRGNDVGFTVTVDSAGRLAEFRATFPRADNGRDLGYEFTVVGTGTRATAVRPTGPVVDAPASAYQS